MSHWTFIALSYGFAAACIAAELIGLARRRRQATERARIEKDFDEDERETT
jgi:hypothetical protein